jgi:CRISPR-associated exonuclease Cas4
MNESDLLPLSALQHLIFCPRQCALIHVEQQWKENALTLEGQYLHQRADETGPRREIRGELVIVRGLALRSLKLGLSGRADVVELRRVERRKPGAALPGLPGRWLPFPVDYKRGRPKPDAADEVQLCAQAICLEEALSVEVPGGALFYGQKRRRHAVEFGKELRGLTVETAERLHELFRRQVTPPAVREPRCERCSLLNICVPDAASRRDRVEQYIEDAIRDEESEP